MGKASYKIRETKNMRHGEYEDIKKKRGGAETDKKRHVICISDGCLEEIGEYATKERCLEVLDEIQKRCLTYLFTEGGADFVGTEESAAAKTWFTAVPEKAAAMESV